MRYLYSILSYLVANAVGLGLAALLLPGFSIGFLPFVVVVAVFSVVLGLAEPLLAWAASKTVPQVSGGISLIAIFFGLLITDIAMASLTVGGVSNWLAATLLIWVGSMLASILLPLFVFKAATKA